MSLKKSLQKAQKKLEKIVKEQEEKELFEARLIKHLSIREE